MTGRPTTAQAVAKQLADECLAMRSRRLTRQITRLYDEAMRPHGIKTSQVNILAAVARQGTVLPRALADALQMEPSTLSRNVSRMRSRGWLAETETSDGRQRPLCLAPAGELLLVALHPAWERAQLAVAEWLGDQARDFFDAASQKARTA